MRRELDFFRPWEMASREWPISNKEVGRFFNEFFNRPEKMAEDFMATPACDITDHESHYVLTLDMPGVKREDLHIEVEGNLLTVWGERKSEREEKNKHSYLSERFEGTYRRTFTLPTEVKAEDIEANFSNGELKVAIPKIEGRSKKEVKVTEGKSGIFSKLLGRKEPTLKVSGE